jgi:hypothetical protein
LDVPNCLARAPQAGPPTPRTDLNEALATVRSLNRQNMDRPGSAWYVVAEAGGAAPETAAADQPLRVVRNLEGSGSGDCSYCPASSFPCAAEKKKE